MVLSGQDIVNVAPRLEVLGDGIFRGVSRRRQKGIGP